MSRRNVNTAARKLRKDLSLPAGEQIVSTIARGMVDPAGELVSYIAIDGTLMAGAVEVTDLVMNGTLVVNADSAEFTPSITNLAEGSGLGINSNGSGLHVYASDELAVFWGHTALSEGDAVAMLTIEHNGALSWAYPAAEATTRTNLGVPAVATKTTTGDAAAPTGDEPTFQINTFDNTFKVYADGAWRQLATW